jgi:N-methylhydantoinase B
MRGDEPVIQTPSKVDTVALEVLWNRVLSVTNEQQAALIRTAFSTVVRESQDLACGVFDTRGNMIAQSDTGTPGHINAMATCMRHFMAVFPEQTLAPGDVLITNDPWMTAGQINDITLVTPIFRDGRVAAYFANTCHMVDIGGRILSAEAREVYEEGLYIPIMKLFDRGQRNETLFSLIRGNVRTPDEVEGDLHAMATCNDVGGRRLLEFMDEFGVGSIDPLADQIIERSERAMRAAIAAIPDGEYENEVWSDGYEEPVLLKARVIVHGDELTVDHTGSSPQSRYGINVVLNYTHAYTSFAIKCAISPEVPHNEGAFRPVHVIAPPGCILNAQHPAPVAARHLIGHFLPGLIFGALAKAIPDRVMADGAASLWITMFRGKKLSADPYTFMLFQCGGTGARPTKDGLNNVGFPSGVAGVPAEVMENLTSLVMDRREVRPDSGGPGRFRGGCGQLTSFSSRGSDPWQMSGMYDRLKHAPGGLLGGGSGIAGSFELSDGRHPNPKELLFLDTAQSAHSALPGGGGFGNPLERDPRAVLADVIDGYVSVVAARRDYGVVVRSHVRDGQRILTAADFALDDGATKALRRGRQSARADVSSPS